VLSRKVWKHGNTQNLSTKIMFSVSKDNRNSLEKVPITLSPHFGRKCRKWLSLSNWNAALQKVFDVYSFWCFVWLYWITKSTMKEFCSFYWTKRNMERRITSLQNSSVLLWSFLIPSCKWINQTRKCPLNIFSVFSQIWTAYNPIVKAYYTWKK